MSVQTATEHVVEVLGRVPFFQGLSRSDLERMADLVQTRDIAAAEFLYREGDSGDKLYVVVQGAVEILRERPLGDHERLVVVRPGEAFGELSVLSDAPRSTSARALQETRLLTMARTEFVRLLGGESLSVRLMRSLARALRSAERRFTVRESGTGTGATGQFGQVVLNGLEPAAPPHAAGYQIAGGSARSEDGPGSALWDGFVTGGGRAMVALLDVQGTGLPPAYLLGVTRAILRELAPEHPFDGLVSRLNAATFRNLFDGMDECVDAAVTEVASGQVRWSCAGNPAGVLVRADGTVGAVPSHGPPLGIVPNFVYDTTPLQLAAGDTLVAFSSAPAGLVKGAVELVRERPDASAADVVRLLGTTLPRIELRGAAADVAFLIVRKL